MKNFLFQPVFKKLIIRYFLYFFFLCSCSENKLNHSEKAAHLLTVYFCCIKMSLEVLPVRPSLPFAPSEPQSLQNVDVVYKSQPSFLLVVLTHVQSTVLMHQPTHHPNRPSRDLPYRPRGLPLLPGDLPAAFLRPHSTCYPGKRRILT